MSCLSASNSSISGKSDDEASDMATFRSTGDVVICSGSTAIGEEVNICAVRRVCLLTLTGVGGR